MSAELRNEMGEAAVAAAKAVGYVGAGTVEFILDANGKFFFMEMNTRLQVEHPVTEMITRQDLVQWQLEVASGNPLPHTQDELAVHGHSFEARIYAENPTAGFLPATGALRHLQPPAAADDVRIETGVRSGDTVSVFYDPMIAKLVVWDADRQSALRKLTRCLEQYQIVGVPTNIDFLTQLSRHPEFVAFDNVDTGFIDNNLDALLEDRNPVSAESLALAATALSLHRSHTFTQSLEMQKDSSSPWSMASTWRMNHPSSTALELRVNKEDISIPVATHSEGVFSVQVDGKSFNTQGDLSSNGEFTITSGETSHKGTLLVDDDMLHMFLSSGMKFAVGIPKFSSCEEAGGHSGPGGMVAPMPGKIVKIMVEPNTKVTKGTPIIAMEAMKMEHIIRAPADGLVEGFLFEVGDQVAEKKTLVKFELADEG